MLKQFLIVNKWVWCFGQILKPVAGVKPWGRNEEPSKSFIFPSFVCFKLCITDIIFIHEHILREYKGFNRMSSYYLWFSFTFNSTSNEIIQQKRVIISKRSFALVVSREWLRMLSPEATTNKNFINYDKSFALNGLQRILRSYHKN